jgi:hypothetical protein
MICLTNDQNVEYKMEHQDDYIKTIVKIIEEQQFGQPGKSETIENYLSSNHKNLLPHIRKGDYKRIAEIVNSRGSDLGKKIGIL